MGPKTQADEIQILRTALERIKVIGADHAKRNTIAGACGAIAICALIEADGVEFERDKDQMVHAQRQSARPTRNLVYHCMCGHPRNDHAPWRGVNSDCVSCSCKVFRADALVAERHPGEDIPWFETDDRA